MIEGPPMVWVLWKVQLCSTVCMRAYICVCVKEEMVMEIYVTYKYQQYYFNEKRYQHDRE